MVRGTGSDLSANTGVFCFVGLLFGVSPLLIVNRTLSNVFAALPAELVTIVNTGCITSAIRGNDGTHRVLCTIVTVTTVLVTDAATAYLFHRFC